jgi:beta-lactamase regulating signal transducer with metallopeptidase domain
MDMQSLKLKLQGATKSLTVKFHATLITISQALDPMTQSVKEYLPSVQPYIKPETVTVVGNILLVVGIIGVAIRAFHTSGTLEDKVAVKEPSVIKEEAPK